MAGKGDSRIVHHRVGFIQLFSHETFLELKSSQMDSTTVCNSFHVTEIKVTSQVSEP